VPDHDPTRADGAAEPNAKEGRPRRRRGTKSSHVSSGGIVRSRPGMTLCGHSAMRVCTDCRHAVAGRVLVRAAGPCRAIDIRTIDRHPLASVGSLVLGVRCSSVQAQHRWP